ncbi:hypothetical protein DUNSADRAFT_5413 [Dunaliella salina]|uniref:Uncharacterized protein n=1 Tax=Dunaliella salina TaxID=3046 RepID=A0ABQ7GQ99_DUNSA|nr:hypothetical protein DUNSADRAFT_5413 [Dunaliella salina]|eukprot:KAF5836786.1 hypothetical protein DUNSADRAFT_5413 [Dunaliella salina]
MLASLVEGYMELQHLDQQLLTSVGRQLLQPRRSVSKEGGLVLGGLTALEAVQVALAFAFFNVQNAGFYQVLLARASSVMQQQQEQQRAWDAEDEGDWQQLVLKLHMACTLAPGGDASVPPGARALLADEARTHFQECRELAAEQAALVWDEEQGQGSQQLLEFQGLDLLTTRQVTGVLALGRPPMQSRHTAARQQGPQQQQPHQQGPQAQQPQQQELQLPVQAHELPLQPELPMPCALVDKSAPWFTVDVALPGHDRVGVVVLPTQLFCRNMVRLRGNMQAQLRCMQALGWAIWPVSVEDWEAMVEQAAAASGIMGGFEGASSCIAQWIAYVAQAEREQIFRRVEDAFARPEESGSGAVAGQVAGQLGPARQEDFLQLLRPEEQERTQLFFSRLQQNVWEGIDEAVSKRQQQLRPR